MKKNFASLALLTAAVVTLVGCVTDYQPTEKDGKIKIDILIDGRDTVYFKDKTIWIQHDAYDHPGKWAGQDLPVYINKDQKWFLEWNGNLTRQGVIENGVGIPRSGTWTEDNFFVNFGTDGFGTFNVKEYPSERNDYTLKIEFDDVEPHGAHWFSADINWNENDE